MAREFRLPDIGEGLTEAEIIRWLVGEGDEVEVDQPVVEVETDKAVVEIPSPYAGVVLRHGGAEGETINVGDVLVVIGEEGETVPAVEEAAPAPQPAAEPETVSPAAPIVGTLGEEAEVLDSTPAPPGTETSKVKALPVVRKLAREHGIDLAVVKGTGPGGRITREDVERAIAAGEAAPTATSEPSSTPEVEAEPVPAAPEVPRTGDERRPMSRLRRTIAANMAKSWAEIPHVTTFDDVDATRLLEIRAALSARHDTKVPLEALVVKAVIPALRAFPEFNATVDGDDLVLHHDYDIGIAVDTPDGLLVAVIRDAASKGVLELATEVVRLGVGAKARTLAPEELTGQTFTVSNIGAVGGGHGTPIVPYGTTAILSVGRAEEKPVVADGELMIVPLMPLSLSYDHRVIDGAVGRRFMAMVMENLEEPALFLAD
ncbi:MAG: dihydrolipoamide acetyltransferase family protein [Acidimicrobiia bacterium]